MGLIITALSTVYNVVLRTVIDPDLPAKAGAASDDNAKAMMAKFGMQQEQIDEAMAKQGSAEEKLKVTPKNIVTDFGISLAIFGVFALILAAIMKKTPPVKFAEE